MKEAYVKPALHLERFALSQNVASGCGAPGGGGSLGKPTHWDKSTCGWDLGNMLLWVAEPACSSLVGADENVGGVCYNNPDGGYNIFSS